MSGIGRLMRFKWRFVLMFTLAVLSASVASLYFVRSLLKPNTGLVVNYPEVVARDGAVVFAPKTPFSPAVASGLQPNADRILAVDGRPVRTVRDVVAADARIWSFLPFPVEVLRNGQRRTIAVRPAFNLRRPDWVFALIFCAALAFTGFYLLLRLPDDTASNFIALAALSYLLFTAVKPFYYESFFSNLVIHLGKVTSWLLVFFALYFPERRGSRGPRVAVIGVVLAIWAAFVAARMSLYSAWVSEGAERWLNRYRFLGKLGNISDGAAYLIYLGLLVTAYFRTPLLKHKRRIEWIMAGFLIGIPPYFFLDQLPLILGEPPGMRISTGNFANLFLAFVPLFFIVGLIKHGVFNIKYFASRYVVYLLLAALIFAFFTAIYEPAQRFFVDSYGLPASMAGFLVAALLFAVLVPARAALSSVVERVFYRGYYRRSPGYSASLEKKNMELRLIIDQLHRQNLRSLQNDKLVELRGIITGIAHRLNNPANYIAGSLRSLEQKLEELFRSLPASDEEPGRQKEEILRLLRIAREGDEAIKDFVGKLSHLVGGRSTIPVTVGVGQLLKRAESELLQRHGPLPLRLQVRTAARIRCYPEELVQVLHYLVDNALEAGGAGARSEIALRADEEGGSVIIEVEDRGPGIEELNLKKIFDPFFTTKAGHEGLGLYFCRTMVERQAGSIEVDSQPGSGTTVRLLLGQESAAQGGRRPA